MANLSITPDELNEKIFSLTQGLYGEMNTAGSRSEENHAHIYGLLTELGRTLADADRASFWRWDKRAHKLLTNAAVGTDTIEIDEGTGLVGKALREQRAIVTNDPYHDPDFNSSVDKATGYVTRSILVMPIIDCKGEIIGAYQAINKLSEEGFDLEEDCRRLSLAALICGLTLESDLFLDDSQHDKLTDIKNRMGFHADFKNKFLPVLQKAEEETPVSLMICDIDHFKRVNDTYGHNAGDAVLMHVAKILNSSIRANDGVYRWGGEEFILILSGARVDVAANVADRIRRKIEDSVCTFEGTDIRVTMSFGVAKLDAAVSIEDNVKVADARLYYSKEHGRNQVTWEDKE